MSDRVLVMRNSRLVAEFSRDEATQENVGAAMMSDQSSGTFTAAGSESNAPSGASRAGGGA